MTRAASSRPAYSCARWSPPRSNETLYTADYFGTGLGAIDTATYDARFIGAYDKVAGSAELTGTGDGRLLGFMWDAVAPISDVSGKVVELDRTSGRIEWYAPQPALVGKALAIAFWGRRSLALHLHSHGYIAGQSLRHRGRLLERRHP